LIDFLHVVSNFVTLFQSIEIIIFWCATFQQVIVFWEHTRMLAILYFFFRKGLINGRQEIDIDRSTNRTSLNTGLNAVDLSPLWVISSHLKHIDEVNILSNLDNFQISLLRLF
jgi:hypothetical protein